LVNCRRTIEHDFRGAVQKFNGSFELLEPLPQTALDILGVLGADGVASEAVRMVGCCKSNVTYWKNKFLRAGALRLKVDGIVKYYELTSYGSMLLTGSERGLRLPVVLEDHPLKFRVLEREKSLIDWRRLGEPRNWRKLGVRIGDVRVVLNMGLVPSVVVHPGQMKGFNVDQLEMDAARIVERVRFVLEGKFGMVLGDEGEALHGPRWRVYRPECKAWVEAGTVEVEGVGGLDHSPTGERQDPLCRRPHLEYNSKRLAAAAVNFPLTLECIEAKVDVLNSRVESLARGVERLVDVLGKLFNVDGNGESVGSVSGGGVQDYVS
jgi:hypothetical protein